MIPTILHLPNNYEVNASNTSIKTVVLPTQIKFFRDDKQKKYPGKSDADPVQH